MRLYLVHVTSQWEVELNRLYLGVIPHSNRESKQNVPAMGEINPIGLVEAHAHPTLHSTYPLFPFYLLPFDVMHVPCYLLQVSVLACIYVIWLCVVSSFLAYTKPACQEINYSRSDSQTGSHLIVRTDTITT